MSKGILYVISGPSGVGKGSIIKQLIPNCKNAILSISATSRNMRANEVEGLSYFFISKEEFEKRIGEGRFLEYQRVYDNYYGTPKDFVFENLNKGINVILEIDINGALDVKKNYPDSKLVYILPPSLKELKRRLIGRNTDTVEQIKKRLSLAKSEIAQFERYDYIVENNDLDSTANTILEIVEGRTEKLDVNLELINKILNEEL